MAWFYLDGGRQLGPVQDADLDLLVMQGKIAPSTLVWRPGLGDWVSYAFIKAQKPEPGMPPIASPKDMGQCSQCRRPYLLDDMFSFGGKGICANCKPYFLQRLKQGLIRSPQLAQGVRYAGFWSRLSAWMLDCIILLFGELLLIYLPVRVVFDSRSTAAKTSFDLSIPIGMAVIGMVLGYFMFMTGRWGGTVGKLALGLKVVDAQGGKIGYGKSLVRTLAYVASGLAVGIGFIMAGFDEQKRALHDHLCSTRVIYKV